MRHDSRNAEALALNYHIIWAILCLLTAANYIAAMVQVEPIASLDHPLAFPFKAAYWLALAQIFMAFFGFLWHVFGSRQHLGSMRDIDAAHARRNGPVNCE
jgi:uncharacterized membrane protein